MFLSKVKSFRGYLTNRYCKEQDPKKLYSQAVPIFFTCFSGNVFYKTKKEEDKKARAGPFRKVVCGIRTKQESLTAFPWGTPISSLSDSMHYRGMSPFSDVVAVFFRCVKYRA